MRFFFISFIILICQVSISTAQEKNLSGKVLNQLTGEPIPGSHLFVPNTSYQTYTDSTGSFIMPKMPQGYWAVKIFSPGFEMGSSSFQLEKNTPDQSFSITPLSSFAPIQKAISSKKREKYTLLFKQGFLGSLDDSPQILLVNPEVLIFEELDKRIKVSASEAVFFRNLATGYLVTTYFEPFFLSEQNGELNADYAYFELDRLNSETAQTIHRNQAALFENSLEYQMVQLLSGETANFEPDPQPKVFYGDSPGEYKLTFSQSTQVTLPNGSKATLSYSGASISLKSNGALVHPEELQINGNIETESPVLLLPSNFEGEKIIQLKNLERTADGLQERIYLHTARGYYWQNESIFFKAYIRYGNAAFADQMSKVLHLELLDEFGNLALHRVFRIENGLAQGFLEPEKPLNQGNYLLKAYTAWSTNYGETGVFYQPVQIMDLDDFPPSSELISESKGISFFAEKQKFGPNEEVSLNIMVQNEEGKPISANISIAVLDLNQTQPFLEPLGISESLELNPTGLSSGDFKIDPEYGFALLGKFTDKNGAPVRGNAELLFGGFEDNLKTATGSDDGAFTLIDRQFEGPFEIAMKATPRDGQTRINKSLEIKRFGEDFKLPEFEFPKAILAENSFLSKEEIISGMQTGEVLMEEAVIESSRERKDRPMIYGTPDNVVDPSEFQLNGDPKQFLFLLASRIPGMQVGGTPTAVKFRGGEPLVLINGIPAALAGTPVIDVLPRINVFAIERVEVVKRLVNTLGDQGRNGVISIITKTGKAYDDAIMANMNSFKSFSIEGFPKKETLQAQILKLTNPDQSQRPVLYWNPNLPTTENNLSQRIQFTTGNQAGPIWLEIRGITIFGEPIYGHFLLNGN